MLIAQELQPEMQVAVAASAGSFLTVHRSGLCLWSRGVLGVSVCVGISLFCDTSHWVGGPP